MLRKAVSLISRAYFQVYILILSASYHHITMYNVLYIQNVLSNDI